MILIIFSPSNVYALNLTIYCKGYETILLEPDDESDEWIEKHRKNTSDYTFIIDDNFITFGSSKYPRDEEKDTYFGGSTMQLHGIGALDGGIFSGESIFIDRVDGDGVLIIYGAYAGKGLIHHKFNSCSTEKPTNEKPKLLF